MQTKKGPSRNYPPLEIPEAVAGYQKTAMKHIKARHLTDHGYGEHSIEQREGRRAMATNEREPLVSAYWVAVRLGVIIDGPPSERLERLRKFRDSLEAMPLDTMENIIKTVKQGLLLPKKAHGLKRRK